MEEIHSFVSAFVSAFASKAPEWVGAIGTVGALCGTIYLARTETRRRKRDDLLVARLHAAGMVLRLVHAETMVASVRDTLAIAISEPIQLSVENLKHIHNRLVTIDLWQVSDLVPLVALPKNTAAKLAQAADQLSSAQKWIGQTIDHYPELGSDDLANFATYADQSLSETYKFLTEAVNVCQEEVRLMHNSNV